MVPEPPTPGSSARVAVIIPCYNDGQTLEEAVDSVTSDGERHEVVVVDDGSTSSDTALALARLDARPDVTVVRQTNARLAAARMTGVAASTAPYLFPLDADDGVEPGGLTELADALEADAELALAWGDQVNFGAVDIIQRRPDHFDPWLVTFVNPLSAACMIRRTSLIDAGGWVLDDGYEDWDLYMALAERGAKGRRIARPINRYRISDQRMLAEARGREAGLRRQIRSRHPDLYASRGANRRRSSASTVTKVALPLLERLPGLSSRTRARLLRFAVEPAHAIRAQRARRSGAVSAR